MELSRLLAENEPAMSAEQWARAARTFALLLAPLAPFLAEELWHIQGGAGSVHTQRWPETDPAATVDEDVTLAVQVNGRFRARRRVPAGLDQEEAVKEALAEPAVQRVLGGKEPARAVYVPDRLLNLLV
jgi:leucyl-tRNA synthetase